MKRALLLVLIAAFLASGARAEIEPARPKGTILTLEECVELALKNATGVLKSNNQVALAGEQVVQAYAQFLPTLDAGAGYNYQTGKSLLTFTTVTPVDSASRNAQFSITSTLNLFNGLGDYSALQSALKARESAQYSLAWAEEQIALDVTVSYLQLILDRELSVIAKKNLDASQARLKLLQGQAKVGSAALADLYRQQAQASSDQLSLQTAEARARDDEHLLVRKLRIEPTLDYRFAEPELEPRPSSFASRPEEELVKEALAARNDLKSSVLRADAFDWDVKRAKSNYLPKLDLNFGRLAAGHYLTRQIVGGVDVLPAEQSGLGPQLGNQVQYAIGLSLTWNILDHGLTRIDVARSRRATDDAEVDASDNRIQVATDVRIALNDYKVAMNQIETARVGLAAAEKAYESIQGRYHLGAASFIDLLASQATLTQSRSNEIQSRVNLLLRTRTLDYVLGRSRVTPAPRL